MGLLEPAAGLQRLRQDPVQLRRGIGDHRLRPAEAPGSVSASIAASSSAVV